MRFLPFLLTILSQHVTISVETLRIVGENMLFKVNSNKRVGLYVEQAPRKFVSEYITKYGWSEFCICNKILFSHKTNLPIGRSEIHTHEFYELTVCIDCKDAILYTDEQQLSLCPGSVVLIKPSSLHVYKAQSSLSRRDFYCLNFRKDIPFFNEFKSSMDFLGFGTNGLYCLSLSPRELSKIKNLLEDIQNALKTDTPYSNAFALTHILEIFLILSSHSQTDQNLKSISSPDFVNEIKQYIDTNFINIDSVSDIVDFSNYSREYISKTFKRCFFISIYEYIILKKILYACELINQGQQIEEAALNSGIHNISSFNRHFKRIIKITPSEYRNLCTK